MISFSKISHGNKSTTLYQWEKFLRPNISISSFNAHIRISIGSLLLCLGKCMSQILTWRKLKHFIQGSLCVMKAFCTQQRLRIHTTPERLAPCYSLWPESRSNKAYKNSQEKGSYFTKKSSWTRRNSTILTCNKETSW